MNYMPIKKEIVKENMRATKVAAYYLTKLNEELLKQLDYTEDCESYCQKYSQYGPNKSDVISCCDNIRKILLDIKKNYQ